MEIAPQSLSSRAMSFDTLIAMRKKLKEVLIPFEQGDEYYGYIESRNHAAFQTHFPIFLEG